MILSDKQIGRVRQLLEAGKVHNVLALDGWTGDEYTVTDLLETIDSKNDEIAQADVKRIEQDVLFNKERDLLMELINGAAGLATVFAGRSTEDPADFYLATGMLNKIKREQLLKVAEYLENNGVEEGARLLRADADLFYPSDGSPPKPMEWR